MPQIKKDILIQVQKMMQDIEKNIKSNYEGIFAQRKHYLFFLLSHELILIFLIINLTHIRTMKVSPN